MNNDTKCDNKWFKVGILLSLLGSIFTMSGLALRSYGYLNYGYPSSYVSAGYYLMMAGITTASIGVFIYAMKR